MNNLLDQINENKIDFVIVNGENAADAGVGLTKEICEDFFRCGVNVITTGNHVWDQKEIMNFIDKESRLLRPKNLFEPAPGKGFEIYTTAQDIKIGVLNLMGNIFMKKCDQTDAGMCGDYDSVIGMNKDNSLNKFMKKNSVKHFTANGDATLCGVIVDCNIETGLANKVNSYIFGGQLSNT